MKAALVFNSPKYRTGANEAILLALMKAREESRSLELLLESSWLLTIKNFTDNLNIPIFLTGNIDKLSIQSTYTSIKFFQIFVNLKRRHFQLHLPAWT